MTRILLIRHARTPETGTRLTGRLPGVSLGDAGRVEASGLADRLASVPFRAVYASPIERTWETALALTDRRRLEPIRHDGLLEVDYGDWSGRTLSSLSRLKAWRTVQTTPSRMRFPGGESLVEAQARAVASCEGIAGRHRSQTVALVTHADVIKALLSHYLGQPLDLFQRITVAPASLSVVDLPSGGTPRIVAVNTSGEPSTWR
ncbi:MAG: histidine phosphatase family protein [Acidimicrobiia bacterium]